MVGLSTVRERHAVTPLSERLIDNGIMNASIVTEIRVGRIGDLGRMENDVLIIRIGCVSVAEHCQIVGTRGQNASASINPKERSQIVERERDLDADRAQI